MSTSSLPENDISGHMTGSRDKAGDSTRALRAQRRAKRSGMLSQGFLSIVTFLWLFPLLYAVYTSFRPFSDTGGSDKGYFSLPSSLTFENYTTAWSDASLLKFFVNTLIIVVPSVILVLMLSSMAAFTVSRYTWKFNLFFLMLFTAGNLLPQQAIIVPLYRLYLAIPLPEFLSGSGTLYDTKLGIILIHVAFQLGFCTFVLSNFMKALPKDLNEAAMLDGAGVFKTFWDIILPLTRPALAALATLQVTWIYNDYFWARTLQTTGDEKPITSALQNLEGVFFTNNNLVAAGSLMVAIPILVVYFALQRHFISGLTLGATKG